MTNIIIIDHHFIIREGIKGALESKSNIQVVGMGDIHNAIELIKEKSPDIVLMEFDPSYDKTVRTMNHISLKYPNSKLIIISDAFSTNMIKDSIRAGINGFVLKGANPNELIDAIESINNGHHYLPSSVSKNIFLEFRKLLLEKEQFSVFQAEIRTPYHLLTKRECEILQLLAEGYSNPEMGVALFISEKTVKNHVSSILLKMKVKDRTNAVINAISNGWVHIKRTI